MQLLSSVPFLITLSMAHSLSQVYHHGEAARRGVEVTMEREGDLPFNFALEQVLESLGDLGPTRTGRVGSLIQQP
jgi:hypothetical protein